MQNLWEIQSILIPEGMEALRKRYLILHQLVVNGRTGRRNLVRALGYSERVLRTEIDFLKESGLIEVDPTGMRITDWGQQVIHKLEPSMNEWLGLEELAQKLQSIYQLHHVIVIHGNSDESMWVRREMGRAAGLWLRKVIQPNDVIAVTGGATMADLAQQIAPNPSLTSNWFVPTRGGLGEEVSIQANSVAANLAQRTGASHRLLHVPDHLSEDAYQSLIQEPSVFEVVQAIRSARIVVHGIGDAKRMAERRSLPLTKLQSLQQDGALAEALGYYFDESGHVVHETPTVGLSMKEWQGAEQVIAVAGGESKALAIAAVMRFGHTDVLITDEAAAKKMLAR